jgi:hypothetical protein
MDLAHRVPELVDRLPGMKAVTSDRITTVERIATWWMMIFATYLIYGQLWGQSIVDKWETNGVASWFKDVPPIGFKGTFLDSFPGLTVSWYLIALLETICFAAIIASVLLFEWLPRRHRPMFGLAIGISAVTFAVLAFGQLLQGNTSGSFQLFLYFGVALLTPFLIDWLDRAVNKRPENT